MKKIHTISNHMKSFAIILLSLISVSSLAQTNNRNNFELKVQELENKALLRTLVDTFSILADVKDAHSQTFLFTENATVETYRNGELVTSLKGRQQIGDVFGNFLKNFKTVYHFNGQHSVKISGNKANGVLYCLTILVTAENVKTTIGIHYNDEYVFENGRWLISRRTSYFDWQEVQKIGE